MKNNVGLKLTAQEYEDIPRPLTEFTLHVALMVSMSGIFTSYKIFPLPICHNLETCNTSIFRYCRNVIATILGTHNYTNLITNRYHRVSDFINGQFSWITGRSDCKYGGV